jgi:hypothetical protein
MLFLYGCYLGGVSYTGESLSDPGDYEVITIDTPDGTLTYSVCNDKVLLHKIGRLEAYARGFGWHEFELVCPD